jgi:hypothetical protein
MNPAQARNACSREARAMYPANTGSRVPTREQMTQVARRLEEMNAAASASASATAVSYPGTTLENILGRFWQLPTYASAATAGVAMALTATLAPDPVSIGTAGMVGATVGSVLRNCCAGEQGIVEHASSVTTTFYSLLTLGGQLAGWVARYATEASAAALNPSLLGDGSGLLAANATAESLVGEETAATLVAGLVGTAMVLTYFPTLLPALPNRDFHLFAAIRDLILYSDRPDPERDGAPATLRSQSPVLIALARALPVAAGLSMPAAMIGTAYHIRAIYGSKAMVAFVANIMATVTTAFARDYGDQALSGMFHNKSAKTKVGLAYTLRIDIDKFRDAARACAADQGMTQEETEEFLDGADRLFHEICANARTANSLTCVVLGLGVLGSIRVLNTAGEVFARSGDSIRFYIVAMLGASLFDGLKEASLIDWQKLLASRKGAPLQLKQPSESSPTARQFLKNIEKAFRSAEIDDRTDARASSDPTEGEKSSLSFQVRAFFNMTQSIMLTYASAMGKTNKSGTYALYATAVAALAVAEHRTPMVEILIKARKNGIEIDKLGKAPVKEVPDGIPADDPPPTEPDERIIPLDGE